VLLTTQYLEKADALADEITVIDHGQVIANDTRWGAAAANRATGTLSTCCRACSRRRSR
jgi:ABC-type multidrug transport system ATPase subunit